MFSSKSFAAYGFDEAKTGFLAGQELYCLGELQLVGRKNLFSNAPKLPRPESTCFWQAVRIRIQEVGQPAVCQYRPDLAVVRNPSARKLLGLAGNSPSA